MKRKVLLSFLSVFISALSLNAQIADSTYADSLLLLQLQEDLSRGNNASGNVTPARTGLSFNPDIGVVGNFGASYINRGRKNFDAYLDETEISFQSVVDPYIRADFFIALSRSALTNEYGVDVEEGYLTTLSLPAKLQLKAGKFKQAAGKINTLHSHTLPFIDRPAAFVNFLGEEGLNDEGLSLSWILPGRNIYRELIVQATAGNSGSPVFERGESNNIQYLAHLKNFYTINDNATIELGLTGITGHGVYNASNNLGAVDITFKWKPVRMNTYHSLTWQSEGFVNSTKDSALAGSTSVGLFSFITYQLTQRWFLTGRYDYAQLPHASSSIQQAYSLTGEWKATEFQSIALEGKTSESSGSRTYMAWLRWIFIIGAHGSHQY